MRKTVVLFAMTMAATPATAQPTAHVLASLDNAFERNHTTKTWVVMGWAFNSGKAKCLAAFEELARDGVPDTATLTFARDTPLLPKGDHTAGAVRPLCERVIREGRIAYWQKYAVYAMNSVALFQAKKNVGTSYFTTCMTEYETMIKRGIAPELVIDDTVADHDDKPVKWKGTISELHEKWCRDGLAKVSPQEYAKLDAGITAALAGDKRKLALKYRVVRLAGGTVSTDPAELAKAGVWFIDAAVGTICPKTGQEEHQLTRHQFDDKHALVKSATTKHCGDPPADVYK